MVTREDMSITAFAIVAYAGDAKTALLKALDSARHGDFDRARSLVEEADRSIIDAHNEQTKMLSKEAAGMDLTVTFLMVHGQDTLMTTMMLKDQIGYMIDEYRRIHRIERQLGLASGGNQKEGE